MFDSIFLNFKSHFVINTPVRIKRNQNTHIERSTKGEELRLKDKTINNHLQLYQVSYFIKSTTDKTTIS